MRRPDRLDIELLQKHLKAIYRCEPVEVPRFDFATQSRLPGDLLKRKPGELLLIEASTRSTPTSWATVWTMLPTSTSAWRMRLS